MADESKQACSSGDTSATDAMDQRVRSQMDRVGKKLLVLSGKGGVGKSTVAANLAVALARAGRRVGLLYTDIHGPSIPGLLGLKGRQVSNRDGRILPVRSHANLTVISMAFFLAKDSDAIIWRGPRKFGAIRQLLADVEWGDLDYLVVDSPPGTGDEPMCIAELVGRPAGGIIVTTPQELAIADVRRCVTFCREMGIPIEGILENMSGYDCPECGHHVDLFKTGGGRRLAEESGVPFLGKIPLEPEIVAAGDDGTPFFESRPDSAGTLAFTEIVDRILSDPPDERDSSSPANEQTEEAPSGDQLMSIAIPVASGRLSSHFGHCDKFAFLEVNEATHTVIDLNLIDPPAHEPGLLPRWLHEQGAQVVIAGGMGQRAQDLLVEQGIRVVIGAPEESPRDLATAYLAGTLQTGENVCDH